MHDLSQNEAEQFKLMKSYASSAIFISIGEPEMSYVCRDSP